MKITHMEFLKRKETSRFEHEDFKVYVKLEEDQDATTVAMEAVKFVEEILARKAQPGINSQIDMKLEVTKVPNLKSQSEEKVATETKAPAPTVEKEPTRRAAKKAEPAAKVEQEEVKEEKKSKRLSTKEVVYDRGNDVHKKVLRSYLDDTFMSWNEGANGAKASKASKELDGKPFLDSEGQILRTFKEAFASYMN
jgi:glucan-binding YG repeat protein